MLKRTRCENVIESFHSGNSELLSQFDRPFVGYRCALVRLGIICLLSTSTNNVMSYVLLFLDFNISVCSVMLLQLSIFTIYDSHQWTPVII